jgi:hypothetical protein
MLTPPFPSQTRMVSDHEGGVDMQEREGEEAPEQQAAERVRSRAAQRAQLSASLTRALPLA